MRRLTAILILVLCATLPACTANAAPTYFSEIAVGGGYGDPVGSNGGLTVDNQGNLQTNGSVTTDGALNAEDLTLTGDLTVAGTSNLGVVNAAGPATLAQPVSVVDNLEDATPLVQIFENDEVPDSGMIAISNGAFYSGSETGVAGLGVLGDPDDQTSNRMPRLAMGDFEGTLFQMVMDVAGGVLDMLFDKSTADAEVDLSNPDATYQVNLSVDGDTTTGGVLSGDSAAFGGGYGSTGVSISNAGAIQANGAITTDGLLTATTASVGGVTYTSKITGPGSSTDNAVVRFDGAGGAAAQNSGVIIGDSNDVTGVNSMAVGGGFGSTGVSISSAGAIQADDAIYGLSLNAPGFATSSLYSGVHPFPQTAVYFDLLSTTNDMRLSIRNSNGSYEASLSVEGDGTFGGGYGSTGVSVSSAGNIQANGTLTVDGATTLSSTLALGGAITYAGTTSDLRAARSITNHIDYDNDGIDAIWKVKANNTTDLLTVTEAGNTTVAGTFTSTGGIIALSSYAGIGDVLTLGNLSGANLINNGKRIHASQSATLSSDAFTATKSFIKLTSQSGTSDNLSTINGGTAGEQIIIRPVSGHTITVQHNTGNIICIGGTNMVLSPYEHAVLFFDDDNKWYVLSNGA